MQWAGRSDSSDDEPDLTAAERKALGNVRLVVELPRVLSAQLEGASGAAPNGLENLVRLLIGSVHVANQAMSAVLAEATARGFERHARAGRADGEARASALADLEYTNVVAAGLYLSAARLLGETGSA